MLPSSNCPTTAGSQFADAASANLSPKLWCAVAALQPVPPAPPSRSFSLTPTQLILLADAECDAGHFQAAEAAYRAVATNPDIDIRSEARFRLGMMLADRLHRFRDAAIEFRAVLDERPHAARVRLELARMDAALGNVAAAERELRNAQANGLPANVERVVRFYASALDARKPSGGSLELTLAPDSNINRATRANTLGTVIGNFTLDDTVRARSGVGLSLRGQGYTRTAIDSHTNLLARLSSSADLYRQSQFDDVGVALQVGPELVIGKDRMNLAAATGWRWYGQQPYSFTFGMSGNWQHPLNKLTLLRVDGGLGHVNNRRNALQDGNALSLAVGVDRALSERSGAGLQLSTVRTSARDPGYADVTGGINGYGYRELGKATIVLAVGYSRLRADARLFIYPQRRVDDRVFVNASVSWRRLQYHGLAPFTRLRAERNRSTVGIYDFKRLAGEVGITSAF